MSTRVESFPQLEPVAGFPERVWRTLHGKHDRQRQRVLLSYPWTGKVLEIGSGRGYVACLIARARQPEMLIGVEPVTRYVAQSRELAVKNGISDFMAIAGFGEQLPFSASSFDWALVSEVLEHVHKPLPILREVARVLRAEGKAVLTVPVQGVMPPGTVAGHVQDYAVEDFKSLVEEAGLRVVEHQTVAVFEFWLVEPANIGVRRPEPWPPLSEPDVPNDTPGDDATSE